MYLWIYFRNKEFDMLTFEHIPMLLAFVLVLSLVMGTHVNAQIAPLAWMKGSQVKLEKELIVKYGEAQRPRLQQGLRQVTSFWRTEDGNAPVFEDFIRTNFAGDQTTLDVMFNRFEYLLEQLNGHLTEVTREFRQQSDLDLGTIYPFDEIFAGYSTSAHVTDDFFQNKLAFIVLLNFPLTTLDERLTKGEQWSRRQWAEVRLAQQFSKRIPADVNLYVSQISSEAEKYISEYNIYMHHLIDTNDVRLFPPKTSTAFTLEFTGRAESELQRERNWICQTENDPAGNGTYRDSDNSGNCR
jgi:hypothetical protein